jgi:cyanate permease
MLSTAVAFHQISLLGERGLSTVEAAANFLPQTAAALTATLAVGALVDRYDPRWLTTVSMLTLAGGLGWGAVASSGWSAIGFGVAIGAAGGSIRSLEAAAFPKYYGTAHTGSIRGFVAAISVGSTAFGPLLFATVHDLTGSYTPALLGTAVLPIAVAAAAATVRPPRRPVPGSPGPDLPTGAGLPADTQQSLDAGHAGVDPAMTPGSTPAHRRKDQEKHAR